jgi:4-oxalmesaconate hydratase
MNRLIDCHGHFTTVPRAVLEWRDRQVAACERAGAPISADELEVSDEQLRAALADDQLRLQREWGIDATLLSPIAGRMAHHLGDADTSMAWSRLSNDLIDRVCRLFPGKFVGVCQLPQSAHAPIEQCVAELERCITQLSFVGCNLNPDHSDGYWQTPLITDSYYHPLYERMVALGVPAMIHTSMSCNPAVHGTCAHYLNGDTTVFMQLCVSTLFERFPDLRLIVPHGGGAAPYHWGRFQGVLQDLGVRDPETILGDNIFFDTCVYWERGMQLLVDTIPARNLLFATEMIGAVKGIDPRTGRRYDDTCSLLDRVTGLSADEREAIRAGNALRVFSRLGKTLESAADGVSTTP